LQLNPRRFAAEFLGTALLVMSVVGSGIMAENLTSDVGVQLLANAIATGGALFGLITIFGPISGASFNPVVTVVGHFVDRTSTVSSVVSDIWPCLIYRPTLKGAYQDLHKIKRQLCGDF
jgi:glycerol uptake facilitator-like aquaporin